MDWETDDGVVYGAISRALEEFKREQAQFNLDKTKGLVQGEFESKAVLDKAIQVTIEANRYWRFAVVRTSTGKVSGKVLFEVIFPHPPHRAPSAAKELRQAFDVYLQWKRGEREHRHLTQHHFGIPLGSGNTGPMDIRLLDDENGAICVGVFVVVSAIILPTSISPNPFAA